MGTGLGPHAGSSCRPPERPRALPWAAAGLAGHLALPAPAPSLHETPGFPWDTPPGCSSSVPGLGFTAGPAQHTWGPRLLLQDSGGGRAWRSLQPVCLHWAWRRGHCWGGHGLVLSAGWGRGLGKGGPRLWRPALTAHLPEAPSVAPVGFP